MRAVVTGADGFAGRWLCRHLLEDGASVSAWVRRTPDRPLRGVVYRVQDIRDSAGTAQAMNDDAPSTVFHLAALTHVASCASDPEAAFDTNVAGTVNVFRAMPEACRGVFASTCHVYGEPRETPICEHHPLDGQGVYGLSKIEAERSIQLLGRDVVIARAFHHTGPGQSERYVLADWAGQVRKGVESIKVGNIEVERDFTDVRDIVAGYVVLAQQGNSGQAYNLCTGSARPLAYFLSCMTEGRNITVEVDAHRLRASDVQQFCGDPTRAFALGWTPRRRVEESLLEMIRPA